MFAYGEIGSLNRLQHYAAFDREGWVVGVAVSVNQLHLASKSVGSNQDNRECASKHFLQGAFSRLPLLNHPTTNECLAGKVLPHSDI